MTEPQPTSGRPAKAKPEQVTDPLTRDEFAEDDNRSPVPLDAVLENPPARQDPLRERREDLDGDQDDPVFEWEPDYDEDVESEPGPDHRPRHPQPRLAPGHHPGPPHGHGPKKVLGKKAPGKKGPGPKKHPGHPPPPHGHGPGPGGSEFEPDFGAGPGAGFGFGPPGFGFGPGTRGRRSGRRGRPGDVRTAILALLAECPMHGYEMIQQIAERSQDLWRPSPGSVYPTLQLLGDEGLIVGSESRGSKKLFELTDEGRAAAEEIKMPPWRQFSQSADSGQVDLRTLANQLFGAVAQAAYAATVEQQQRVAAILKNARRQIYTLLAESE